MDFWRRMADTVYPTGYDKAPPSSGPERKLLVDKPRSYVTEEAEDTVFNLKEETFTVEDAVEHMGIGKFQLKMFFVCGLFSVSSL